MIALIVDDDLARHRYFEPRLAYYGYRVAHAQGYNGAVEALASRRFDLVLLDHDLCIRQVSDGCSFWLVGKTGEDVVDYIISLPRSRRPRHVIVHSWNRGGARKMVDSLRAAQIPVSYQRSPI